MIIYSIALLVLGCTAQPAGHSFEVRLEDGVPVAVTSGGPLYEGNLFTFREILKVRQDESIPASLLNGPREFGPGPDGTLVVLEWNEGRAVAFNPEGHFLRQIGGKGAGPGEFERIRGMRVLRDSMTFYDPSLIRLSIFNSAGALIDVVPLRDYGSHSRADLLSDGTLALYDLARRTERDAFSIARSVLLIRMSTGDTLAALSTGYVEHQVRGQSGGIVLMSSPIPCNGEPFASSVAGSTILVANGRSSQCSLFDSHGRPIRQIRLNATRRPVTEAMIEGYWQAERDRLAIWGRTLNPEMKDETQFPDEAGWWRGIIVDDSGFLWMMDATSYALAHRPHRFFVFSPEGRYLGNAVVPSDVGCISEGLLYAIVRNPESGADEPTVFEILARNPELDYP